jgi:hypothetical protein
MEFAGLAAFAALYVAFVVLPKRLISEIRRIERSFMHGVTYT